MNKIAKTFVAGSIVFGTALGISVSNEGVITNRSTSSNDTTLV